jgi:hypothetical protein
MLMKVVAVQSSQWSQSFFVAHFAMMMPRD